MQVLEQKPANHNSVRESKESLRCCSATSNIWHTLPTATKLPTLRPYTRASTCSRHNRAAHVSLRCHNYPKIPTPSRSPMKIVMPAANGRPEYTRQAPLTCLARLCVGNQAPCTTNAPEIGLGQAAPSHHLYMNQQLRTRLERPRCVLL